MEFSTIKEELNYIQQRKQPTLVEVDNKYG